jgi:hypothetical protein
MIKKNFKLERAQAAKKSPSPPSESSYSSEDTDDDLPSGFTSDSYSDDGDVYASLSWPSWIAFCRSLGLAGL